MKELGTSRSFLPGFIFEKVLDFLRDRIKEEHGIDIKQLEPIQSVSKIDVPLLFITSVMDEFVMSEDVVDLYKQSGSKVKQL